MQTLKAEVGFVGKISIFRRLPNNTVAIFPNRYKPGIAQSNSACYSNGHSRGFRPNDFDLLGLTTINGGSLGPQVD